MDQTISKDGLTLEKIEMDYERRTCKLNLQDAQHVTSRLCGILKHVSWSLFEFLFIRFAT